VAGDIDFVAEGLTEGLSDQALQARLTLLERLAQDGYELDELREAVRFDLLILLRAEAVVGGRAVYTADEIAQRSGVSRDFLAALRRAHGMPIPEEDIRQFSEIDLEAARLARDFSAAGLSEEQMLATARVLGRGLAQVAEVMRATALEMALEPGADEAELAERYRAVAEQFAPMTAPLLTNGLRMHLRNVLRNEAVTVAERESGRLPGAREVAVCFADLVGFTQLGEELPPDDIGAVAERLEEMTAHIVCAPVRFVKTIGDAAMLVSPEAEPLLENALELVDAAAAERDFPRLRAGVAFGPALRRAGDYYGRPVNLASRITGIARPGSVLVTQDVQDAVEGDFRFSFAGSRAIRGVPDPVKLFRARGAEPDRAAAAPAADQR
jgi:adenylate cyclase